MAYRPVAQEARGVIVEARGVWNIRNVCIARKDDGHGKPVITAGWLASHDTLLEQLLQSFPVIKPRKRYSVTGDISSGSIHMLADDDGRIYITITKSDYSHTAAHLLLKELYRRVIEGPHNKSSRNAQTIHELSNQFMGLFDNLVDKYDDAAAVDPMTRVAEQLELVESRMQQNVRLMLENDGIAQQVDAHAEQMIGQAEQFEASSADLRKKMWWRSCKFRLCVLAGVLGVLAVIIIPMAIFKADNKEGTSITRQSDDLYYQQTHPEEANYPTHGHLEDDDDDDSAPFKADDVFDFEPIERAPFYYNDNDDDDDDGHYGTDGSVTDLVQDLLGTDDNSLPDLVVAAFDDDDDDNDDDDTTGPAPSDDDFYADDYWIPLIKKKKEKKGSGGRWLRSS